MRIYLTFVGSLLFVSSFAQKKAAVDSSQLKLEKDIYKTALKYGDLAVAKGAVYKMLALNPGDKSLRDSLLFLYFNAGSFGQSVLLSRELLAEDPSKSTVLEIKAIAEQNLGLVKESLESYEKLFVQTKSIFHQYQIAVLQYQLKRFGECQTNLDAIIKSDKATAEKVNISLSQQESQQVLLKAAALNIKGVMDLESNRNEQAKASFQEAIKIQPDFQLALNNLSLLEKKSKPTSKAPSAKPAQK